MSCLITALYHPCSSGCLTMWPLLFNTSLFVLYAPAALGNLSALNPCRVFPTSLPLLIFPPFLQILPKLHPTIFQVPPQMPLLIQNFLDLSISTWSLISLKSHAIFHFFFDHYISFLMVVILVLALSYLPSKPQLREKVWKINVWNKKNVWTWDLD